MDFKEAHKTMKELDREVERLRGRMSQISEEMKSEFGVTIEEAAEHLDKLKAERDKTQAKADKYLKRFKDKWRERLQQNSE